MPDETIEDFDPEQTFEVGMLEGCMAGEILADGERESYFYGIYQPFKFIAAPDAESDTAVVKLRIGLIEGGPARPVNRNLQKQKGEPRTFLSASPETSTDGRRAKHTKHQKKNDGDLSLTQYCFTGEFLTTTVQDKYLPVVKKTGNILLGQTKFYRVVTVSGLPKLEEFTSLPPTSFVEVLNWSVTSLTPLLDTRLGVYYEHRSTTGEPLAGTDRIRLIGRYWEPGKTFKVRLTAATATGSASMDIEVKRPTKLLTEGQNPTFEKARDVNDQPINIDDSCIVYGGRYGIPPHFIKGHMLKEAGKKDFGGDIHTGFAPTYVFEPYTAQFGNWHDYRYKHGMWVVDPTRPPPYKMGLGKVVPSHSHVQDFQYPTEPQKVWDMIRDHSQLVNDLPGLDHKKYGKRVDHFPFMDFYSYDLIQGACEQRANLAVWMKFFFPFVPETIAEISRDLMIHYLRYEWAGPKDKGVKGAENMDAQTRLASSYGLLQLTFTTAVEKPGYPHNDSEKSPEDLNDLTTNLFWSMTYYQELLGPVANQGGSWPDGFEPTFKKKVWAKWNPGGMDYANEVYPMTLFFSPK